VLWLQSRVQAIVASLLRLVEIHGGVVELEVSELLWVPWPAGARRCHPTLLVLVCWRPNVVRIVSRRVQVLVLAQGQGLVVLPLAHRC
jgi:hypothetical protein